MTNNANKLSVTIGICAFNEEKGIGNLIHEILAQKQYSYVIEEIVVVNDMSSDATEEIVLKIAEENPCVKVVNQPKRSGKSAGMNYLYKHTTTDMLITFDADIHILTQNSLESLVQAQVASQASLVFGRVDPLPAKSLLGKIIFTYEHFWRDVIDAINSGSNIHRCLGCYMGFTRELYSQLQIPRSIQADDHYIYLFASSKKLQSIYCPEGGVGFRVPEKFGDYMSQCTRYVHSQESIVEQFDKEEVETIYTIPLGVKARAYMRSLKNHPVLMSLACVLQVVQRVIISFRKPSSSGLWSTVSSTK